MDDWKEFTGKTVDEALAEALLTLETKSENVDFEVIEKESSGMLGMFKKPAKIRVKVKYSIEGTAKTFLKKIFEAMKVDATIEVLLDEENETVEVNIIGEDMGVLIGKRGQTLDSLQYLVSLVVNKGGDKYLKVKLDTENYRERRKETLENLAKNISFKVKKTHKPVALEPMNPYERRIIHSALQNDKFVETHSEGEEPYRKVVIAMKKGIKPYVSNNNHGSSHGSSQGANRTPGQGFNHGAGQGARNGAGQGFNRGAGQGTNSGTGQGFNHGVSQGSGNGMGQGASQNTVQGTNQGQGSYQRKAPGSIPGSGPSRFNRNDANKNKCTTKEFHQKYGGNSKDYSRDYKKDYAAYLEEKAAAKAATEDKDNK